MDQNNQSQLLKLQRTNENLETQTSNDKSVLSKIVKTAVMYGITNSAISRTRFKDTRYKSLISLATAIATNAFTDNTDEDTGRTLIAGAAFIGGAKLTKEVLKANGYELTNWLKNIDNKNVSLREKIFEFNQKHKENAAGKYSFDNKEQYYDFLFDTKTKSLAGQMMEDQQYSAFINRNIARNNQIDETIGSYFDKYNQIKKRGGFGFFDRTLKNLKVNDEGEILYNSEQIFKSRGDFDVIGKFANNFKNQIKNYEKTGEGFNDDFFDYLKAQRPEDEELVNQFKEFYQSAKVTDSNTQVSINDLIEDSIDFRYDFVDKVKKFGISEDSAMKWFGNMKVRDMSKNANGKIFDSSILDYENLALDFAQMIDKSIRPPFSFIPGELHNFSLVPFDIKSAILKKESSDFKIINTNIDYDNAIEQLQKTRKHITSNNIARIPGSKGNRTQIINNKDKLINNIDNKIEQLKYESEFVNRNMDFFDDTAKQKLKFSIDYDNNFEIIQSKSKTINSFIYKDDLYKKQLDNQTWKKEQGKFDFTYSKMFKENQTAKYNASRANKFGDYGQFEEADNDNKILSIAKQKLKQMKDKNGEQFNSEVDQVFNELKQQRQDLINRVATDNNIDPLDLQNKYHQLKRQLIKNKDSDQLAQFFNLDEVFMNSETKGVASNLFDLLEHNKLYTNLKNANSSIKEDYIKAALNTKKFNIESITDSNQYFNTEYLKQNYYKSLFPAKRGTIVRKSQGISDLFSNKNHEIGTLENAYFNNFFNKFEDSLSYLGIKKLDPHSNNSTVEHLKNVMLKRIIPFLGIVYGIKAADGLVDSLIPDNTFLGNGGVTGMAAKSYAATRLGFQVLAQSTGIKGATQYLIDHGFGFLSVTDLNLSTQEMYDRYFKGKEVAIRRNRFWFSSGRDGFEGGAVKEYRQSLLYKLQNRTPLFYDNKWERFYREDFLPTKIWSRIKDPYLEERRLYEKGLPLDKSEQLFRDVPLFGELLSSTLGQAIKPTVYYNNAKEINPLARITDSFLTDLKSFGGYQGYVLSKASDFVFGGKSITEVLNNNGFETRELASVDRLTSISHDFNQLELGGMFGLTEPFRRLIPEGVRQTKSIMTNQLPAWYTNNSTMNNLDILDTDYNPVFYKSKYQDNQYKNISLIDRLTLLANTNPNSTNYYNYKNMAMANINKGKYNNEEIKSIYDAISIADNLVNDNYSRDQLNVPNQTFDRRNISIDNVISNDEIISNGKRIKFAGIETDFNKLSERIGSNKAIEQMNKMKEYLTSVKSLDVITNQDQLKTVKSDSKGQYIEVYSKFLHDNFDLSKDTYFQQTSNSGIVNGINKFFDLMGNQTVNMRKAKFIGNRTTFDKWQDSLTIPEYRDWDNINQSFIQPTGDLMAGGLDQKLLAYKTLASGALTKDTSSISALGLTYLGGNALFGNNDSYYQQQSKINELIQQQKFLEGKATYYNVNEYSTNTEIQKTLNKSEQKMFYDLVNDNNSANIKYIEEHGNAQLKRAMEIIQNKKMNYLNNTNIRSETIQEETNPEFQQDFQTKYDYYYNTALAKKQLGLQLSLIEKRKLNQSYYNQLDLTANVSQEVLRNRIFGSGNYITSTIYNNKKNDTY